MVERICEEKGAPLPHTIGGIVDRYNHYEKQFT